MIGGTMGTVSDRETDSIRQALARANILTDDLDGTPADETLSFSIGGRAYEIDLSRANADTFREVFQPWIAAARPRAAARQSPRSRDSRAKSAAIRDWAQHTGIEVKDRGRLPSSVKRQYENRITSAAA